MKKLKKIFSLFPEIDIIEFNENLEIICKKKNGTKILCTTFKQLKQELKS